MCIFAIKRSFVALFWTLFGLSHYWLVIFSGLRLFGYLMNFFISLLYSLPRNNEKFSYPWHLYDICCSWISNISVSLLAWSFFLVKDCLNTWWKGKVFGFLTLIHCPLLSEVCLPGSGYDRSVRVPCHCQWSCTYPFSFQKYDLVFTFLIVWVSCQMFLKYSFLLSSSDFSSSSLSSSLLSSLFVSFPDFCIDILLVMFLFLMYYTIGVCILESSIGLFFVLGFVFILFMCISSFMVYPSLYVFRLWSRYFVFCFWLYVLRLVCIWLLCILYWVLYLFCSCVYCVLWCVFCNMCSVWFVCFVFCLSFVYAWWG